MKLTGATATLLEWDDRIPSFDEVHREALKAGKFCKELTAMNPSPPKILRGVVGRPGKDARHSARLRHGRHAPAR